MEAGNLWDGSVFWHYNGIIMSKGHPEDVIWLSVQLRVGCAICQFHRTIQFPLPVVTAESLAMVSFFTPLQPPCCFSQSQHAKLPWHCQCLRLQAVLPGGASWNRFFAYLLHPTLEFSSVLNLLLGCGHTVSTSHLQQLFHKSIWQEM